MGDTTYNFNPLRKNMAWSSFWRAAFLGKGVLVEANLGANVDDTHLQVWQQILTRRDFTHPTLWLKALVEEETAAEVWRKGARDPAVSHDGELKNEYTQRTRKSGQSAEVCRRMVLQSNLELDANVLVQRERMEKSNG